MSLKLKILLCLFHPLLQERYADKVKEANSQLRQKLNEEDLHS